MMSTTGSGRRRKASRNPHCWWTVVRMDVCGFRQREGGPIRCVGSSTLPCLALKAGNVTRAELRHYVLQNGKLERTIPVALGPQDFTAYWLGRDWREISRWSDEGNLSKLKEWQAARATGARSAQFGKPTLHCKMEPDLWQVSTEMGDAVTQEVYFVIRWRRPYDFTMVSAGVAPRKECKEEDPAADERRSLFPRP